MLQACKQLRHRYFQITGSCNYHGYQHGLDIMANLPLLELTLAREMGVRY